MRVFTRSAAVLGLLLAASAAALVRPSWACGCGAMITSGSDLRVDRETSIVRYDDRTRTEQIVMRLSVRSDARDAAWLFPTPSRAEVRLGDAAWFKQLDKLTEPRVVVRRDWWGGGLGSGDGAAGGAPGRGVTVLGEQRLGPFEVATLASEDSRALADWLSEHGYKLSPRLRDALQPYVRMGWKYVAVKLSPEGRALSGAVSGGLSGELAPLHVSFRSDEIVYPMRLSRLARNDQAVHLYVLAGHRVTPRPMPGVGAAVAYAGWVEPHQVASPGLHAFLGGRMFMTELVSERLDPGDITDDFRYRYTADEPYHEVRYRTEYVTVMGVPAGYAILLGALLLVAAVTAALLRAVAGSRPGGAAGR